MIETVDAVLFLDRLQNSNQARVCNHYPITDERHHGKLWVHKSGSVLFCQQCDYKEPVTRDLLTTAQLL